MEPWRLTLIALIEADQAKNKLNDHTFGAEVGVSHVTVGKWRKGLVEPGPRSWRALARRWGLPETPLAELKAGVISGERGVLLAKLKNRLDGASLVQLQRAERVFDLVLEAIDQGAQEDSVGQE